MSTPVLTEDDRGVRDYAVRPATSEDLAGARSVMLDTVYREFETAHNVFVNEDTGFGYAVGEPVAFGASGVAVDQSDPRPGIT
jgi:hypothetical protein